MSQNNNSRALKAGFWYTVSNIALRAVSVFTAPIFTRLLTTSDYGKFNNFFSWQTILACLFGLCLNYSIGRAKIDFKEDFDGFISSIQTLSILTGLSLLIISFPFLDSLCKFMEIDKGLLVALMVMLIVSPSVDYLQSKFRFEYRYKENVLIAILMTVGVIVLSILFILLSELDTRYIARILGGVVPTLIIGLFAIIYLYFRGKTTIKLEYWRYALRISIPMIPHGLAMVLLAQIDRIMLIKMVGDESAGLYSFGYSYALIISVFTNAIMNAWQPWLYESVKAEKYEDIQSSNRKINILAFVLTLCFIIVGPEVVMLLGSPAFHEAKWMVAPVLAGCFFQFIYGYFTLMELYCKRTEFIALGSVFAALLKIGLNMIFIPHYGFVGAAYATMIGYAALMLYHWIMYRHIFKPKIFAEKQLFTLVTLLSICTVIIAQIYEHIFVRYILLIILIMIFLIIYRTSLIKVYSYLKLKYLEK